DGIPRDGDRRHELALDQLGAAAVVRQRGDRANDWLPAYADAEIGLEPPDRDQDRTRDAEALLDARQQVGVLRQEPLRLGETRIDAWQCELLEALPEYPLPPVKRDHLRVGGEVFKCRREGALRNPLCGRLARERRDKRVEVTTAGSREHRRGGSCELGSEVKAAHSPSGRQKRGI